MGPCPVLLCESSTKWVETVCTASKSVSHSTFDSLRSRSVAGDSSNRRCCATAAVKVNAMALELEIAVNAVKHRLVFGNDAPMNV